MSREWHTENVMRAWLLQNPGEEFESCECDMADEPCVWRTGLSLEEAWSLFDWTNLRGKISYDFQQGVLSIWSRALQFNQVFCWEGNMPLNSKNELHALLQAVDSIVRVRPEAFVSNREG